MVSCHAIPYCTLLYSTTVYQRILRYAIVLHTTLDYEASSMHNVPQRHLFAKRSSVARKPVCPPSNSSKEVVSRMSLSTYTPRATRAVQGAGLRKPKLREERRLPLYAMAVSVNDIVCCHQPKTQEPYYNPYCITPYADALNPEP